MILAPSLASVLAAGTRRSELYDPFRLHSADSYDHFRRHIICRMMGLNDLYSDGTRSDYPAFRSAWEAGRRLVGYCREHALGSVLILPEVSLFPAIKSIVRAGGFCLLGCDDNGDAISPAGQGRLLDTKMPLTSWNPYLSDVWPHPVDAVVLPCLAWSSTHNLLFNHDTCRVLSRLSKLCDNDAYLDVWRLFERARFIAFASEGQRFDVPEPSVFPCPQAHVVITGQGVHDLPGPFHGIMSSLREPDLSMPTYHHVRQKRAQGNPMGSMRVMNELADRIDGPLAPPPLPSSVESLVVPKHAPPSPASDAGTAPECDTFT